jgi:hypothetical protein
MQDDEVEQTDEAGEPTAEDTTADTEGAADDDAAANADAMDQQAATSEGTAAEEEPEVPDDSSDTIKAAQEHINTLDMDQERNAAEKAQKQL